MKLINQSLVEIKKSKFIGYFYHVEHVEEVEEILKILKTEHKKAKHFPYAYKIGNCAKKSDDKEPSNTAGSPLYTLILRKNLDCCLLVVVRYFGGIKLGAGGLLRAYNEAANQALKYEND